MEPEAERLEPDIEPEAEGFEPDAAHTLVSNLVTEMNVIVTELLEQRQEVGWTFNELWSELFDQFYKAEHTSDEHQLIASCAMLVCSVELGDAARFATLLSSD